MSSTKMQDTLELALPNLYAAIMVFSVKARQYLEARCRVYHALYDFIMMLKRY